MISKVNTARRIHSAASGNYHSSHIRTEKTVGQLAGRCPQPLDVFRKYVPDIDAHHQATVETVASIADVEPKQLCQQLKTLREMTQNYRPPESACRSWKRFYRELKALDFSVSEQIYLEREVLFPRFQF